MRRLYVAIETSVDELLFGQLPSACPLHKLEQAIALHAPFRKSFPVNLVFSRQIAPGVVGHLRIFASLPPPGRRITRIYRRFSLFNELL